jgi:hypothetical protein
MKRFLAVAATAFAFFGGLTGKAQSQTNIQGWVEVDIFIQLVTAIPTGSSVFCSATIATTEVSASGTDYNSDTGYATASVSGSQATCKVSIPYTWSLSTQSSDTMTANYTVTMAASNGGTVTGITRLGDHSLPSIPVPADGVSHVFIANTKL